MPLLGPRFITDHENLICCKQRFAMDNAMDRIHSNLSEGLISDSAFHWRAQQSWR